MTRPGSGASTQEPAPLIDEVTLTESGQSTVMAGPAQPLGISRAWRDHVGKRYERYYDGDSVYPADTQDWHV